MKYFLFVLWIALGTLCFGQIDSTNRYNNVENLVYDGILDSIYLDVVDTNIKEVFQFNFIGSRNNKDLGVFAGPTHDIQYKGFENNRFGEEVFVGEKSSKKLYLAKIPFVRAAFVQGPKKFQKFDITFAENIRPQLGFAVNFQNVKSEGFYLNQELDRRTFSFNTYYKSKDGSISSVIGFDLNSGVFGENGGISDLAVYDENINANKVAVPVYLETAKNNFDDRKFFYDQEVRLVKLSMDSSRNDGLFLFNSLETYLGDYWYSDTIGDSLTDSIQLDYYARFGYGLPDSVRIWDQYRFESFSNFGGIRFKSERLGNMVLTAGFRYKEYKTIGRYYSNFYYGTSFKANLNRFNIGRINLDGMVELELDGFNSGGYILEGSINYALVDSIITLDGGISSVKQTPSFKSLQYGNRLVQWNNLNRFGMIDEFRVHGDLSSQKFEALLGFDYSSTQNFVYYDLGGVPNQFGNTMALLTLKVGKDFQLGDFHLDVLLNNQQKLTDAPINVPEWVFVASLYHQRHLFNRALEIRYGFDYWQTSTYYGDNYAPFVRQFVYQTETEVGSYPFVDFHLGMRVKTVQGFVKAQNIFQAFLKDRYMMVPNYSMNDLSIYFGLQWDFFN